MNNPGKRILSELKEHLPFTILSACVAIIAVGFLTIVIGEYELPYTGENLFHIFHPLHVLASAATTTAMFWKYKRNILQSAAVGAAGAVVICLLSDIIFPFAGGKFLGIEMVMHICLVKHPMIILPFLAVGILMGFTAPRKIEHSTIYSHSAHILLSTMASLVYLISFGMTGWLGQIGWVFVMLVLVVLIPCCLSDIVFPLFFTGKGEHGHSAGSCH